MDYQKRHFLHIKKVSTLIGISISIINRGIKEGTFPPKHKLSAERIVFHNYHIDQWKEGEREKW